MFNHQIPVILATNLINLWYKIVSSKLLASAPNCRERPFVMEISFQAVKSVFIEQATLTK